MFVIGISLKIEIVESSVMSLFGAGMFLCVDNFDLIEDV